MTYRRVAHYSVAIWILLALGCRSGGAQPRYKVDGLTDEAYFRICGTWDTYLDIQTEEGTFSWGKGRHVPNGSVDIDLGADPPSLSAPWGLFHVRSVRETGKGLYVLSVIWKRTSWTDERFDVVLQFGEDGSMWWLPEGIMGRGNDGPYYKLDGPKKGT